MKHLKLFEEFETPLIQMAKEIKSGTKDLLKAAEYWRNKKMKSSNPHLDFKAPGVVPGNYSIETPEDLNIERMEKKTIMEAIIKNYTKSYKEIADLLGLDTRTLFRKLDIYDLKDLKRQLKTRNGVMWDHPYNEITPGR